ncbi:MAG: hypothetical protein R3E31_24300 [Chloroflexota bacterium]
MLMGSNGRFFNNTDHLLLLATGGILGFLSALVGNILYSIMSAIIIAAAFAIYYPALNRPQSLRVSLITGGAIGLILGCIDWLIGGTITNVGDGLIFGLTRGGVIGGIAGLITRVDSEDEDSLITKTFLVVGSVFMGTILGGSVGTMTGLTLGFIGVGTKAIMGGVILGSIVGGYLGSYYKQARWIRAGATAGAALGAISALAGPTVSGIVLGAMSGAIAPMLLVALIGAVGGLTSRGVKAMIIEALEAPTEMLEQGAVPFLVPAIITGLIVGTAASGPESLVTLPAALAFVAATLGTLAEFGRRANTPEITPHNIIEMAMMGAENWPVSPLAQRFAAAVREKETLLKVGIQVGISVLGTIIGIVLAYITLAITSR